MGVEDINIKIQRLLGERMVNKALRYAMFLAARPRRTIIRAFWESRYPPNQANGPKTTGMLELWEAKTLPD
jgi:hypothetical protein